MVGIPNLDSKKKRDYISTYIPYIGENLRELLKLKVKDEKKIEKLLRAVLEKKRGKLEEIKVDTSEFEEELALEGGENAEEKEK